MRISLPDARRAGKRLKRIGWQRTRELVSCPLPDVRLGG